MMLQENKKLIEEFPFLLPKNSWAGEVVEDYDYSFTELDNLEDGWRKRFGLQLCKDLKECLVKANFLDEYYIVQIKEKYGQLRWYDNFGTEEWDRHLAAWTYISEHTCVKCGAFPVLMRDDGWVSPYCDNCFKETSWPLKNGRGSLEEYTCKDPFNGRLFEYLPLSSTENYIDLKPYYSKIGYTDFSNLITIEEYNKYKEYKMALKEWETINGKIDKQSIIPYEILEINPFRR